MAQSSTAQLNQTQNSFAQAEAISSSNDYEEVLSAAKGQKEEEEEQDATQQGKVRFRDRQMCTVGGARARERARECVRVKADCMVSKGKQAE